ncbi:hypothetical protein [Carnobacterium sp. 17-4]|uniref:hypothetical protein n=1 Tax=Carnobacterium sp. (strain 17-4) TaxID=208596 RepID=UPI0005A1FB52|nr:hypothetical protein [Carnobacterium sp. 17-4]
MRKQNKKKKAVTNLHLSSLKKGEYKEKTPDSDKKSVFQKTKSVEHTLPKLKKQASKKTDYTINYAYFIIFICNFDSCVFYKSLKQSRYRFC